MELNTPIDQAFRTLEPQKKALNKLRIKTVEDLLFHFPVRYGDTNEIKNIGSLTKGENATVFGIISGLKTSKAFIKKTPMSEATVTDETGRMKIVWFNQPYIAKMIRDGAMVRVEGRVSERKRAKSRSELGSTTGMSEQRGDLYFSNPKIENVNKVPIGVGQNLFGKDGESHFLYPVYPESRGVTSNWMYHNIERIFKNGILEQIIDPIPKEILEKYNLPNIKDALIYIHAPKKEADASAARKRFAFQEIFFIQLEKQRERAKWKEEKSFAATANKSSVDDFVKRFPFTATSAQKKAIETILSDFSSGHPMARLLEGDVGSGKTAVAAATTFAVVTSRPFDKAQGKPQNFGNLQVAYMAPTEILAKQQFENFIQFFKGTGIAVGLITGSGCRKFPSKITDFTRTRRGLDAENWTNISKAQLTKWVANGEIPIIVGTHALISKTVKFKHLAYVIIDEQHRFGVNQRALLLNKETKIKETDAKNTANEDPLLYRDLTYRIRECVFRVKKELGLGHKENVYQKALAEEFEKSNIKFSREHRIPILYRTKNVGTYIPDFVIENKIIIELKALPFLGNNEVKQVWNYLKGSDFSLALLINWSFKTVDIKRIVFEQSRSPREVGEKSASSPHLLSMTATPIPRTLSLTIYGDLDLSLLDEMPAGRKPVITKIVLPKDREQTYKEIEQKLKEGRQLYVICPRINEPDPTKESAVIAKSVTEEAKRLQIEIFPNWKIGIQHSKMTPTEKEKNMLDFAEHKTDILVATSVVEVGVNVPNATMIVIEGAERFGLSQLHQLRGRVIRSNHQAYCFVFAESSGTKTVARLKALSTAKNGFELAEFDLSQRGSGELYSGRQWGVSDLAMDALQNIKMVEAAREESKKIIAEDLELKKYPLLKNELEKSENKIHFE